jgi:peptidyl-prolyl cis-trans isomerase C
MRPSCRRRHRAAAVFVASAFYAITASAQAPATPSAQGLRPPNEADVKTLTALLAELDRSPDTVLADVGSRTVTRADVAAAIRAMPALIASRPAMDVYQQGVGMAMQQKALAARAVEAGLDKLPSVAYRERNATEDVLADAYLHGMLNANITDDVLRRAYDQLVAGKPGPDEVKARIIVTDTEQAGEAAIARLNGGASFDTVARTDSIDGSATDGGSLGYVRADMLAPDIAAVLFSMGIGAITAHPVPSSDRWFVLKVEGRRVVEAPTFDQVRPVLARDLAMIEVARFRQQMVSDAKVVYRGTLVQAERTK